MKQITIISGKGGTGKTTLTASFAALNKNSVIADCDVDAPDLHLLLKPQIIQTEDFVKGLMYKINQESCIQCGKCLNICRFEAVKNIDCKIVIDDYSCEKCGLCMRICPVDAIYSTEEKSGEAYLADTEYGKMVYARLNPGAENSGKLVSIVRNKAGQLSENENIETVIIDGPPGKGCPVIASITNVDAVIIVTEPTVSGISDFIGVADLAQQFKIKTFVIINKSDININNTNTIIEYCSENNINYLGSINYDKTIVDAVNNGMPVVKYADNKTTLQITDIWSKFSEIISQ